MVKILYCDRCGEEISRAEKDELLNDVFENFDEGFFTGDKTPKGYVKIIRPHLCEKCLSGYNELIYSFNNKLMDFLGEKAKKAKEHKKKFGLFGK